MVPTEEPSFIPTNSRVETPSLQPSSKQPVVAVVATTVSPTVRSSVSSKVTVAPVIVTSSIRPSLQTANSDSSVGSNGALQAPVIAAIAVIVALVILLALYVIFKTNFIQWCQQSQSSNHSQEKYPDPQQSFNSENPLFRKSEMR